MTGVATFYPEERGRMELEASLPRLLFRGTVGCAVLLVTSLVPRLYSRDKVSKVR